MTTGKRRRGGFTLIEVLIVVVIMAVLAATIIPQFSSSTNDAKTSSLQFNLHSLRSQIELYKLNHNGALPQLTNGTLPQLMAATDINGNIGVTGPTFPYGPYLLQQTLPANPFTNVNTVTATTSSPPTAPSGTGGWLYNTTTGQLYADQANFLNY
ncbi:MAG TPA: type II secretion system protein [Pirellulales bacterium]|nr:type II secretion system protein [Pirellulales bacterium]